jgi:iron complex transport system permease protein
MLYRKVITTYLIMPFLLFLSFFFSLMLGSNDIGLTNIIRAIFGIADEQTIMIVNQLRIPRIIAAMLTGGGLAASGCIFQAILKNPLADPFTLGISGGASLGAAFGTLFAFSAAWFFIPLCAFIGALIAVFVAYLLTLRKRFDPNSIILAGVIMSYIFSSAVMLLFSLSSANQMQAAFVWLMGGFSVIDNDLLKIASIIILTGILFLCISANIINILSLNIDKSQSLGLNINKTVQFIFIIASLITAASISICGIIGFIGLMSPHIMRKFVGANHIFLIPASVFAGAAFLPLCDALGRTIAAPVMIPPGVITNIAGGLFFLFLLLKDKKA